MLATSAKSAAGSQFGLLSDHSRPGHSLIFILMHNSELILFVVFVVLELLVCKCEGVM